MCMKLYFGNYNLRGYLRLDLCVALENSIHSDEHVNAVNFCFYADLTIYEFCNLKRIITVTTVVEGLMSKPGKDDDLGTYDDSRGWIGGSGWSKTQKVQIVHQLECSYASIMLSLRYYLCLLYTNYASTKKQCYVVSCSSVYFYLLKEGGQFEQ